MSNLNELSSSVQNLAKQYASVIKVGEFLASLGSLDNLAGEIEARVAQAKWDEAAALEAYGEAKRVLREQLKQNQQAAGQAHAQAEKIVSDAHEQAAKRFVEVSAKAAAMDAEDEQRRKEFEHQYEHNKKVLAVIEGEVAFAEKRLAELNGQYEALRAKFA